MLEPDLNAFRKPENLEATHIATARLHVDRNRTQDQTWDSGEVEYNFVIVPIQWLHIVMKHCRATSLVQETQRQ